MLNWLTNLLSATAAIMSPEQKAVELEKIEAREMAGTHTMKNQQAIKASSLGSSPLPSFNSVIVWDLGGSVIMEPEDAGKPGANYSESRVQYRLPSGQVLKTDTRWGGK